MGLELRPPAARSRQATAPAAHPEGTPPPVSKWRARRSWLDIKGSPYLYIAPFFLLFAIFGLFPIGYTFWVSLHNWSLIGGREFTGLQNYSKLMHDEDFLNSVINTFGMFVIATVPQLLAALGLASLLNQWLRARTFFRMGVLVPMVTSVAAVAIVFSQLYGRDYGMVNWVLGFFGVDKIEWQADKWSSWIAISTMVDWRWTGYNTLIYLAAMQAIPRDLYEAAAIDGASRAKQFWRITVPLLRPTIIFTSIIATIGGLQLFTEPLLFGSGQMGGGSLGQFQTMTMYMFENAFRNYKYGYGAAIAWVLFVIIILASLVNFLFIRRIRSAT
jgi:cellobiose transport system permease protein